MDFIILGKPIPLKRSRSTKSGYHYNSQKNEMKEVSEYIKAQLPDDFVPFTGALHLIICFHIEIPKSFSRRKRDELKGRYHTCRPDNSNILKFYEDALNGILWHDDCIIAKLTVSKFWQVEPRTLLKVVTLE